MRHHTETIAEAARQYVHAITVYEQTEPDTARSARCAAELGRARESLIAAVEDEGVPSDQRRDVERFVAEGGCVRGA